MIKKKRLINGVIVICLGILIVISTINSYVIDSTKKKIISLDSVQDKSDYVIVVLGASVYHDRVSMMLKDRLDRAIDIYNIGFNKILITGDGIKEDYDETSLMYKYLVESGVQESDIIIDKKGVSTSESMYRAKNIFGYDKILVVTQEYHMYRAIYLAKALDMEVYGVVTNANNYKGHEKREIREMLARVKDYFKAIIYSSKESN